MFQIGEILSKQIAPLLLLIGAIVSASVVDPDVLTYRAVELFGMHVRRIFI